MKSVRSVVNLDRFLNLRPSAESADELDWELVQGDACGENVRRGHAVGRSRLRRSVTLQVGDCG